MTQPAENSTCSTQQPKPRFEEPWHADVFALTVLLNEKGLFSWGEWTTRFGQSLAEHRLDHALNGGSDYFLAWIDALEGLLMSKDLAAGEDLARLKQGWTDAYLSTPHGQPVRLAES